MDKDGTVELATVNLEGTLVPADENMPVKIDALEVFDSVGGKTLLRKLKIFPEGSIEGPAPVKTALEELVAGVLLGLNNPVDNGGGIVTEDVKGLLPDKLLLEDENEPVKSYALGLN